MTVPGFEIYSHPAAVHGHEHIHMTHYAHHGAGGQVEHLVSTHQHEHNHPPIQRAHVPHQNPEKEHEHEAHIHDHAHPTGD